MSTSPYFDGSTSVVRYDVQRAGTARPGVTSYTRERGFPRATRYNNGVSYNSRGYDYPYDYDLTLAEQRELELEEIRLAEYRRNEYPRAGGATIITTGAGNMRGGKTMYLSSGRPGMDRYPSLGYSPGVRTVSVERSGPIIHRGPTRYSNQPVNYAAFGEYATDYDGLPLQAIRVPASSGGRIRQYPTRYDSRRVFGAPCRYESDYSREPLVVVPSGSRTRRYL